MIKDIASNLVFTSLDDALAVAGDTPVFSNSIDTAHLELGVVFDVVATDVTAGEAAVTIQESDDDSTWTDIPAEKYVDDKTGLTVDTVAATGALRSGLGCFSTGRYLRVAAVGNDGSADVTLAVGVVAKPEYMPVDDYLSAQDVP